MEIKRVISWIGVFALAMGSLISAVQGGFISALFGILFLATLVSVLLPLPEKLATRLSPRLLFLHRALMQTITLIGTWTLAALGGWEFVPAAVLLSVSLLFWPVGEILKRRAGIWRRERANGNVTIYPGLESLNVKPEPVAGQIASQSQSQLQSPPPIYTSTVKIVQDDCKSNQPQCPVIQTPPVFNV